MRISDCSSDVCSSDLLVDPDHHPGHRAQHMVARRQGAESIGAIVQAGEAVAAGDQHGRKSVGRENRTPTITASRRAATPAAVRTARPAPGAVTARACAPASARAKAHPRPSPSPAPRHRRTGAANAPRRARAPPGRSEEHTSEQSLMRNSYAVFCLKKKTKKT